MRTVTKIIAGLSIAASVAGHTPGAVGQTVTKAEYEKTQMPGRPGFEQFREFDQRRMEQLEKMAEGGGVDGAIARFYLNKEIDKANQLILEADLGHWTDHIPQFALYEMFNADNGHRAKLMSREATDKLHAHMWECFQPKHGKGPWGNCRHYPVNPEKPSEHWGNQNHGFVFQSWFYTAATALKDIPKYADQFDPSTNIFGYSEVGAEEGRWAGGDKAETMADYAESLRQMWSNRLRWMAGEGVWWEDKVYRQYSIATLYNMATHANDPVIRKRASMMLDVHWTMYALHMVDGQMGGAMNRYKGHYSRYHYDRGLGSYYFGGDGGGFHATEVAMYTDYVPPQIAYDLLADQKKRGCFTYRERLAAAGGDTYKQSYVTPEYVLGSYIKHDKLGEWFRYSERAFQGITFGQARARLRLQPEATWQPYHGLQHGPVLLARWFGKVTPYLSIYATENGGVEIEPPIVENGWVFGKAGDAYYALRPAEGEFAVDRLRFNFPEGKPEIPFIVHAGGLTEDGSFEDFKKNVLANEISYKDGVLTYTTKEWGVMRFNPDPTAPPEQLRQVNGEPVALPDKLFDSPYLTSDYDSGVITATFGDRKLILDFNKNERRVE